MWKIAIVIGLGAVAASTAYAHPSNIAYDTRGKCESAMAHWNNMDRERDWGANRDGRHPSDSNRYYHETWSCVEIGGSWYMRRV